VETELQVIIRELNDEMVRLGKIGPDAAGVGVMLGKVADALQLLDDEQKAMSRQVVRSVSAIERFCSGADPERWAEAVAAT
jgi:hypothetical protein